MPMYHNGNRELQSLFGSTALADRLEQRLRRSEFTEDDKTFIESLDYFFLATATPVGQPDCSFKGGPPGFVRVAAPDLLVFPDYDGNGMFKSLGNIAINPSVGLLFIRMGETPKRLRANGTAQISLDDPLLPEFPRGLDTRYRLDYLTTAQAEQAMASSARGSRRDGFILVSREKVR